MHKAERIYLCVCVCHKIEPMNSRIVHPETVYQNDFLIDV